MINRITIFRVLLLLFVLCHVAAIIFQDVGEITSCPTLQRYQEALDAEFGGYQPERWRWVWPWLAGHLIEVVGLVLLFCRMRLGLWLACLGAALSASASWFGLQPHSYPFLRTDADQLLWSATCIFWGGYVSMALTDQQNIFAPKAKS